MSDPKISTWTVAESPITIEYSLVVIEEIRQVVAEGFQRLSRGGIEVGGALYGTREGRTIRVLAIRPISCEHARGPSFVLSDKDRAALSEQLTQEQSDPHLQDLIPLGWFVSHTRSEIALSEADLDLYATFFPAPWQVTLVIRPGRGGTMRAGFFVREENGTIKFDRSYLDFSFPDRLAGVLDRLPRDRASDRMGDRGAAGDRLSAERMPMGDRRASNYARPVDPRPMDAPPYEPRRDIPGFAAAGVAEPPLAAAPAARRKWPWLMAWGVVMIAIAVLGLRYFVARPVTEPIALSVLERDGQLQIGWNNASKTVTGAARGTLEITDGKDLRTIPLSSQDLSQGKFTYVRKTGDVQVRLTVENSSGEKTQEASSFLGQAPVAAGDDELTTLKQRRDELEAQVRGLQQQNDEQAGRIQQLERTLLILRTRLGVDSGR